MRSAFIYFRFRFVVVVRKFLLLFQQKNELYRRIVNRISCSGSLYAKVWAAILNILLFFLFSCDCCEHMEWLVKKSLSPSLASVPSRALG